jgi:hypothetical protein
MVVYWLSPMDALVSSLLDRWADPVIGFGRYPFVEFEL